MNPKSQHIILIEDKAVTRMTLAGYLESFGYRITECESAAHSERVLGDEGTDLLIVDINLVGKDGCHIPAGSMAVS